MMQGTHGISGMGDMKMDLHETVKRAKAPAIAMAAVAVCGEVAILYSGIAGIAVFLIQIILLVYAGNLTEKKHWAGLLPAGGVGALVGIIGALSASLAHSAIILTIHTFAPCPSCIPYGVLDALKDFVTGGAFNAFFWAIVGFILGAIGAIIPTKKEGLIDITELPPDW
ncbi:MAG: hypothetical protein V1861_00850 [Candidatus Micrarchaeota archaeon]